MFITARKLIIFILATTLASCVQSAGRDNQQVSAKKTAAPKTSAHPADGKYISLRTQPWQNMFKEWSSKGPCQVKFSKRYMKDAVVNHLYQNFRKETVKLKDFNILLSVKDNDKCKGNVKYTGPGTLMYFIEGITIAGAKMRRLIWFQTQWVEGAVNGYVNLIGFDTSSKKYPNPGSEKKHKLKNVGQYKIETELVPIGDNSEFGVPSGGLVSGSANFLNGLLNYRISPQVPISSLKAQKRSIRIILQLHSSINPLAGTVDVRKFVRTVTLSPSNGFTATGSIKIDNVVTGQQAALGLLSIRQKLTEIEISSFFID